LDFAVIPVLGLVGAWAVLFFFSHSYGASSLLPVPIGLLLQGS